MTNAIAEPTTTFVPTEGTDFELDFRGIDEHGQEGWEWTSCGPTFDDDYSSDDTYLSKEAAIADAVEFLTMVFNEPVDPETFRELEVPAVGLDIELPETSPYISGVHFALCTFEGYEGVYWQGLCQEPNESDLWFGLPTDADFAHLSSSEGYFNDRYAAADCIFSLHIERGFSVEDAVTLVFEQALPIHTILEENSAAFTQYTQELAQIELSEHWSRLWASRSGSHHLSVRGTARGART